jgi:hypothetical protein
MSVSEAGDEIEEEEEEIYEVPPDAVEIWRLARRLSGERENGKVLTAKALAVLRVLLWAFHNGEIPDYETIGYEAGCSRATTALAIKAPRAPESSPRLRPFAWRSRLPRPKSPHPARLAEISSQLAHAGRRGRRQRDQPTVRRSFQRQLAFA